MIKKIILSLLILSINHALNASVQKYGPKDLLSLKEMSEYGEYLDHAYDVLPSQRDTQWKNNTIDVAIKFVKALDEQKNYSRESILKLKEITRFNILKSDHFFSLSAQNYLKSYFSFCYQNKAYTDCLKEMTYFLDNLTPSSDFSRHLSKLSYKSDLPFKLREKINLPLASDQFSDIYCKEDNFIGFFYTVLKEKNQKQVNSYLNKNLSKACFDTLRPGLVTNLLDSATNSMNSDIFLKIQSRLTKEQLHAYYLKYLLTNPSDKGLFNLSWNGLHKLNQSYQLRKDVLDLLKNKKIDTFLFTKTDTKFVKTVFNHVKENVPEIESFLQENCALNLYCKSYKNKKAQILGP